MYNTLYPNTLYNVKVRTVTHVFKMEDTLWKRNFKQRLFVGLSMMLLCEDGIWLHISP